MSDVFKPLLRALSQRDHLSADEIAQVRSLPFRKRIYERGEQIIPEGARLQESCLVVKGFTLRASHLRSGKRQINGLHVPGDFVDLPALLLKKINHNVVALNECEVAFFPHRDLRDLCEREPHLARMLWLLTVCDGAVAREWITSIGRRVPEEHLAHLICETYTRLNVAGLARDNRFEFPITQADIADIMGLSVVHMNRTIQELRSTGEVTWKGTSVSILDFEALATRADFDATYLNLWKEPR